jgi:hypothetical protein
MIQMFRSIISRLIIWGKDLGAVCITVIRIVVYFFRMIKMLAIARQLPSHAVIRPAIRITWHNFKHDIQYAIGRHRGRKPDHYSGYRYFFSPQGVSLLAVKTSCKPSVPSRYAGTWQEGQHEPYELRLVAFLDILGWRDIVTSSLEQKGAPQTIAETLMRSVWEGLKIQGAFQAWDYQAAAFSDSIIVSLNGEAGAAGMLFRIIDHTINAALMGGWLVRGGIAFGPMFHRGAIAFGPA